MTIEITNESGVAIDETVLLRLTEHNLAELHVSADADVAILLVDDQRGRPVGLSTRRRVLGQFFVPQIEEFVAQILGASTGEVFQDDALALAGLDSDPRQAQYPSRERPRDAHRMDRAVGNPARRP